MNNALNALVFITLVGLASTTAVQPEAATNSRLQVLIQGVAPDVDTYSPTTTSISFTQPPELQGGEPTSEGAIDFYRRTFETLPSERQHAWEEAMQAQVWRNLEAREALETILIDILEITDEFTPTPGRPPIHELLIVAKRHRSDVYALLLSEFGFSRLPKALAPFYPRPRGFENQPVPFLEEGSMAPASPAERFHIIPRRPGVIDSGSIQPL